MDFKKLNKEVELFRFDSDSPEQNILRARKLSILKVAVQEKYWDAEISGEKINSKLLISDAVREGKNKEQREAIMELEKANNPEFSEVFDVIERCKRSLAIIGEVERFNNFVIKIKEVM